MDLDKLIQKQYLWIDAAVNFGIHLHFSTSEDETYYSVHCTARYDIEKKKWNYDVREDGQLQGIAVKKAQEKIQTFFENELKENKEEWEKKAHLVLSSLMFKEEYKIERIVYAIEGDKKISMNEVKVGEKLIDLNLYIVENNKIDTLQVVFEKPLPSGETKLGNSVLIKWSFMKKYNEQAVQFEHYLRTKSKDRLLFLF